MTRDDFKNLTREEYEKKYLEEGRNYIAADKRGKLIRKQMRKEEQEQHSFANWWGYGTACVIGGTIIGKIIAYILIGALAIKVIKYMFFP